MNAIFNCDTMVPPKVAYTNLRWCKLGDVTNGNVHQIRDFLETTQNLWSSWLFIPSWTRVGLVGECGGGFSKVWQPFLHRVVLPSKKGCYPGGIGCQIEHWLMWFKYWPISCPWMNSSQLSLGLDSLTLPFWSTEFSGSIIKFVIPLRNCFYFLLWLTLLSA